MTWGHARSPDMIHWTHQPHALRPDQPYDKDGVYSGCCIEHQGVAHIFYTATQPECQCLATSTDMRHFVKHPANYKQALTP